MRQVHHVLLQLHLLAHGTLADRGEWVLLQLPRNYCLSFKIGIYAIMDKWSSGEAFKLNTIFDVIFNIGFLLLLIGVVVFIVSFAGCIGALRENMCLLR